LGATRNGTRGGKRRDAQKKFPPRYSNTLELEKNAEAAMADAQ
jgi:hypothetical protein